MSSGARSAPGSQIIRTLDASRHSIAIGDPKAGLLHKPDWTHSELVLDLASMSEPKVVVEAQDRGYKFALSVTVSSAGVVVEEREIELR